NNGQVAMREVDDVHDAEQERQSAGEERVEAAEQDALNNRVHPAHASAPGDLTVVLTPFALAPFALAPFEPLPGRRPATPKYAPSIWPGVRSAGRPSSVIRPSSRQCTIDATRSVWLTSCSTSSTVTPPASSCGSSA